MSNCKRCRKHKCHCKVEIKTTINSESAGRDGLSAYEIAVIEGKYIGNEAGFIDWLKGQDGKDGPAGVSVTNAVVNKDGDLIITLSNGNTINAGNAEGSVGPQGDSAYQVALKNGFTGSEEDWLNSLKGEKGDKGSDGKDGHDGTDGKDGAIGDGVFKSIVFTVSETKPATPTGGTWLNPIPTTPGWHDGIPDEEGPRWASSRIFTLSGADPQEPVWTEPSLLADTADIDFEFSSVKENPGNPTTNPENWSNESDSTTEWMAVRKYSNAAWSEWDVVHIKGENGLDGKDGLNGSDGKDGQDGKDGADGADGEDGTGYEFQYTVTNRDDPAPDINNDDIWSSTFPGAIDSSQALWYRQRTVKGTIYGAWVGPFKLTGADGETVVGPSMAYRGDWSAVQKYLGTELVVDVVKYNDLGYMAKTDAGEIPVGTLPTDDQYWVQFEHNIDSLFTDFLFAYSAYVQNLTVGQVATGTEPPIVPDPNLSGERFTVGFQPTEEHDPTVGLSRHMPRLYWPSGRIMKYEGYVSHFPVGDGLVLANKAVIIWFKDEEGSPIDYYIDQGGTIVVPAPVVTERWYYREGVVRLGNSPSTNLESELLNLVDYTPNRSKMCYYWAGHANPRRGRIGLRNSIDIWEKMTTEDGVVTSRYVVANNSDSPIPDGFYMLSGHAMSAIVVSETDDEAVINLTISSLGWVQDGYVLDGFDQRTLDGVRIGNSGQGGGQDCDANMPRANF